MIKNVLKTLIFGVLLITMVTGSFESTYAATDDYTQKFSEIYGTSSIGYGRSPIRVSGVDQWPFVTSRNNQPRSSGQTNPHQGTDITAQKDTEIYPIYAGTVVDIINDPVNLANQLGAVIVKHTVNGSDYYVRYAHIIPNGSLTKNQSITVENVIGVIDEYKVWAPHLHIQAVTSSTASITTKLFPHYRTVSAWNYGEHLDYISGDAYVGNKLYINAGANTTGPSGIYNPEKIELYYKIGSTGTWTKSTTTFSLFSIPDHRWYIDLKAATGAASGNTIYFYIVATRVGPPTDPSFTGTYKVGFWPQYFKHPSAPLTTANANLIAKSFVIQ